MPKYNDFELDIKEEKISHEEVIPWKTYWCTGTCCDGLCD